MLLIILIIILIYKYFKRFENFTSYIKPKNNIEISFCITCLNRFDQLKNTLQINLEKNIKYNKEIEFILVNFIMNDEGRRIDRWVRTNMVKYIKNGYLKYYISNNLKEWNACIAKNTSHRYGTGRILYNLDCDNFVTPKEIEFIKTIDFEKSIYYGWSGTWKDGTGGRVSMTQKQFRQIGGYDQGLLPTSYQDIDLLKRVKIYFNLKLIIAYKNNIHNKAIENDKELNTKYVKSTDKWSSMLVKNKKRSFHRIKNKDFINHHELGVTAHKIYLRNIDTFYL